MAYKGFILGVNKHQQRLLLPLSHFAAKANAAVELASSFPSFNLTLISLPLFILFTMFGKLVTVSLAIPLFARRKSSRLFPRSNRLEIDAIRSGPRSKLLQLRPHLHSPGRRLL